MPGVSAYTKYYFDEDTCSIMISNTESLDQYRFGKGIAAILHNKQAAVSYRPEEIFLSPKELEKYTVWAKIVSKGDGKTNKQYTS